MARKPSVAILGAGRVGQSLGRGLRRAGYPIGAIVTRMASHARRARQFFGGGRPTNRLGPAVLDSEIFLIATPDRAIPEVASELARLGGKSLRGKIALHTSGALTSEVLQPLARRGARVGSMHPLQTFSRRGGVPLEGVVFGVEGDRVARRQAARMARELGGIPVAIRARQKALYHAAATMACGRLLALGDAAARMLVRAGIEPAKARRAVARLASQTLANFERAGGRAAWTGPLERGDLATLGLHARALRRADASVREAYRALGELALCLYRRRDQKLLRAFRKLFRS